MNLQFKIMFIAVFSGICILLGVIFGLIGFFMRRNYNRKLERCTYRVAAVVTENRRRVSHMNNHRHVTYAPVFSYTVGAAAYEKTYCISTGRPRYAVGQSVYLLCDYENVEEFYVEGDHSLGLTAQIFGIVGIVLLAVAAGVGIVIALL